MGNASHTAGFPPGGFPLLRFPFIEDKLRHRGDSSRLSVQRVVGVVRRGRSPFYVLVRKGEEGLGRRDAA
jgi:hypothetical protein